MGTIRSYTTIEQSKVLANILPRESADMYYPYNFKLLENESTPEVVIGSLHDTSLRNIPCWSLVALLNAVPQIKVRGSKKIGYIISYNKNITTKRYFHIIDACYEMVVKLYELNLLF